MEGVARPGEYGWYGVFFSAWIRLCLYSGSMDHREPLPMLWKTREMRGMLLEVLSGALKGTTQTERSAQVWANKSRCPKHQLKVQTRCHGSCLPNHLCTQQRFSYSPRKDNAGRGWELKTFSMPPRSIFSKSSCLSLLQNNQEASSWLRHRETL